MAEEILGKPYRRHRRAAAHAAALSVAGSTAEPAEHANRIHLGNRKPERHAQQRGPGITLGVDEEDAAWPGKESHADGHTVLSGTAEPPTRLLADADPDRDTNANPNGDAHHGTDAHAEPDAGADTNTRANPGLYL
jgi:hypothetical protein